jgi:hypothetical protein
MIGLGKGVRVLASTKPKDMRKSFRALAVVVTAELNTDPLSGAVYSLPGPPPRFSFFDRKTRFVGFAHAEPLHGQEIRCHYARRRTA